MREYVDIFCFLSFFCEPVDILKVHSGSPLGVRTLTLKTTAENDDARSYIQTTLRRAWVARTFSARFQLRGHLSLDAHAARYFFLCVLAIT